MQLRLTFLRPAPDPTPTEKRLALDLLLRVLAMGRLPVSQRQQISRERGCSQKLLVRLGGGRVKKAVFGAEPRNIGLEKQGFKSRGLVCWVPVPPTLSRLRLLPAHFLAPPGPSILISPFQPSFLLLPVLSLLVVLSVSFFPLASLSFFGALPFSLARSLSLLQTATAKREPFLHGIPCMCYLPSLGLSKDSFYARIIQLLFRGFLYFPPLLQKQLPERTQAGLPDPFTFTAFRVGHVCWWSGPELLTGVISTNR